MLITLEEAAQYLAMSVSGLRKVLQSGKIKYTQNGKKGRIKFRKEWLDEFIEENTPSYTKPYTAPKKQKKKPITGFGELSNGLSWDLFRK